MVVMYLKMNFYNHKVTEDSRVNLYFGNIQVI